MSNTITLIAILVGYVLFGIFACGSSSADIPVTKNFAEVSPTPVRESRVLSQKASPVTIAAVGDIMLGSTSINETFLPPNDGANLLKEVAPILSAADIAFGNLEGPILEGGTTSKCSPTSTKCFAFRVPPRYGLYLKEAGFDVLSLANNHAGDFGDLGRTSTRQVLDDLKIKHAGSDRGQFAMTILEAKDKRIAFIGFAHNNIVPNINDLAAARTLVEDANKKADIVVVSFHGGGEGERAQLVPNRTEIYVGEARGNLPAFARTVIDAGADLVLGHGPHVLRGLEMYKDRLIVYSMGNFATYGMFNLKGPQGLTAIFEIELLPDGKFSKGKIRAGKQLGRGGPVLDPSGEAIGVIKNLSLANFGATAAKISPDGSILK